MTIRASEADMPTENDFTNALYHYKATVTRIIDGDTAIMTIDLGCRVQTVRSIRLLGYDAPELFSGPPEVRSAGAKAQIALATFMPVGSDVYLHTQLDHTSFERLLARVYVQSEDGSLRDVADYMLSKGFGVPE